MKTRIISGAVMGCILAVILTLGFLVNTVFITVSVALLAAFASYELLHNASGIISKPTIISVGVYVFLSVFSLQLGKASFQSILCWFIAVLIYPIFGAILVLRKHKEFNLAQIFAIFAVPTVLSLVFFSLGGIIISRDGIYCLLLLLNFSSVNDMGAYFVGVKFGKHKLCPEISPKKTVEGALGGLASSIIVSIILALCFKKSLLIALAITIPFCAISVVGDLLASAIKRSVGLKDYSNLIPGHGGILDRVDSVIMVAPIMYILKLFSVI